MGAGGRLGGHHVGDIHAGNQQNECGQQTENAEESAIFFLEIGDASASRRESKLLIHIAINVSLACAAETRGAPGLEGVAASGEVLAERLEGGGRVDAGFQHQEGAVPGGAFLGGDAVHADGQKDVGDYSLFRSSEIARADADDFKGLVADVKRATKHVRVAAKAMIPVVPGEDRIRTGTGAVIGGGEETGAS